MGIGDDIRPKHRSHFYQPPAEDIPEDEEKAEEKLLKEDPSAKNNDADSFFESPRKNSTPPPSRKSSGIAKTLALLGLWLLVIFVLGFLVYKNYASIKNLVIGAKTPPDAGEEEKLQSYEGVIAQSQDYTATTGNAGETAATGTTANTQTETSAKATLKIKVLNGNGIRNSAATIRDILTNAGYSVEKIANASRYTYTKTYIYYKTGQESWATEIKSLFPNRVTEAVLSDAIVGNYDIVIVTGKS